MKASFLLTELLEEILVVKFNLIFPINTHSSGESVLLESTLSQVDARMQASSFGKCVVLPCG